MQSPAYGQGAAGGSGQQEAYVEAGGLGEGGPRGKFVEPRLRFERDVGRRRLMEILRAVAHDGRVFEHGQQGKAWIEHVEALNTQEIFQINGKGALKVGTAKEKFMDGLKAWKEETRRRMEAQEPAPPETEMDTMWRRCVALEAYHQSQDSGRGRPNREEQRLRNQETIRQVLQMPQGPSRKRTSSAAFDELPNWEGSGVFDRDEMRAMAERKLAADEKRAMAEETRAKAELMASQAKMVEKMLEARAQGVPVPDDFMSRFLQ